MDDSFYIYRIRIEGELDEQWSDWFTGMAVAVEDGRRKVTTLTGAADQSALRGILNKIWDLNLVVISINPVDRPD
jgi:hypothetical protein